MIQVVKKKWSDSGHILKEEPTEFADGLNGVEGIGGIKRTVSTSIVEGKSV